VQCAAAPYDREFFYDLVVALQKPMANTQQDLFQSSTAEMTRAISNVNTSDISGLVTRLSRRRPPRSTPARRLGRASMPGAIQPKSPNSPAPQNGNVSAAETITSPGNQPQKTASEPEIVRLTLDETQSSILSQILDRHREATRITGLLAAVTRSYRAAAGMVTVELQLVEVDQRTIAALCKLAGR
jgi:hypothetical protein